MPIYEYACRQCNAKFDQLVRTMSGAGEGASPKCPGCGSEQTARSLSVFAVGGEATGKSAAAAEAGPGMCGRCGGAEGSCMA